jgi:hypothetical protein
MSRCAAQRTVCTWHVRSLCVRVSVCVVSHRTRGGSGGSRVKRQDEDIRDVLSQTGGGVEVRPPARRTRHPPTRTHARRRVACRCGPLGGRSDVYRRCVRRAACGARLLHAHASRARTHTAVGAVEEAAAEHCVARLAAYAPAPDAGRGGSGRPRNSGGGEKVHCPLCGDRRRGSRAKVDGVLGRHWRRLFTSPAARECRRVGSRHRVGPGRAVAAATAAAAAGALAPARHGG